MKPPSRGHSWLHPALETRDCESGKGVFAKGCFAQGDILAIFGGHVMPIREEPVFSDGRSDLAVQIHENFVLGSKFEDEIEEADCFNHSCSPNAGFKGQIFLVAMRDIEPDEQVCFDYGMVLRCAYRMECKCGSPNCRKIITGDDWQIPEIQARYDGWFQWYLQEMVNKLRGQ